MKVILVNGSPHEKGCTYTALCEVEKTLREEGIDTEIFWIGSDPISGCRGCGACFRNGGCVIKDRVADFAAIADSADGFVFGTPVHFASAAGGITSFMDRVFYSCGRKLSLKPGACGVSARRAGTTATFDQMNQYLTICQMPVISSYYWNEVHGRTPEDVAQDLEGLAVMRQLGRNMAWFLKLREAGEKAGIGLPKQEQRVFTNFIR